MVQTIDQDQQSAAFRQTTRTAGQVTQGTHVAGNNERRNSQLAYYSDEDEN